MKSQWKNILTILSVIAILCPTISYSGLNQNAEIQIDYQFFPVDQKVQFFIYANDVNNFKGFNFEILINNDNILDIKDVKEGNFLSGLGGSTFFMNKKEGKNFLWVANAVEGDSAEFAPSGFGLLFTFIANFSNINEAEIKDSIILKNAIFCRCRFKKRHY